MAKPKIKLDTKTAREKLPVIGTPYWLTVTPGRSIGYHKPNGGGAGTWRARFYNPDNRVIRKTALGTADDFDNANGSTVLNFAQAQEKAREWFKLQEHLSVHGSDLVPHDGPFTVWDAVTRYLDKSDAKSVDDMRSRAELWIKPTLGDIEVSKLTKPKVEAWRNSITESAPKRRTKAGEAEKPKKAKTDDKPKEAPTLDDEAKRKRKATSNRTLTILKAALNTARREQWVICPPDAWELVKPYHDVEEPRQAYLTPIEQTRLLNAIQEPDFRRIVAGGLATGARYGDLCRLKVGDFDPSGEGSVFFRSPKQGKSHRVMLTNEGHAFFSSLVAGRHKDELMFLRDNPERRTRANDAGAEGWAKNDQMRRMKDACQDAGLPQMGFHQLRHSYASALVSAGIPLALVAKLTGHKDTRMLERHYAHLAPSELSRALKALAPNLGLAIGNIQELEIKKA